MAHAELPRVRRFKHGGYFYTAQLRTCGPASNCTACPHGPYWYRSGFSMRRQEYVGRELPSGPRETHAKLEKLARTPDGEKMLALLQGAEDGGGQRGLL